MLRKILVRTFTILFILVIIVIVGIVIYLVVSSQIKTDSQLFSSIIAQKDKSLSTIKKSQNLKIISPKYEESFNEGAIIDLSLKPSLGYFFSDINIVMRDNETLTPLVVEKISDNNFKVTLPKKLGLVILQVSAKDQVDEVAIVEVPIYLETSAILMQLIAEPENLTFNAFPAKQQLIIKGFYSDNGMRDLTRFSTGIRYRTGSWKNDVVSVSKDGLVTVIGNGHDEVVINHELLRKTTKIPVAVDIKNYAPILSAIKDIKIKATEILDVPIKATDSGINGSIVFSSDNLPSFIKLVDNGDKTAVLQIKPQLGDEGRYDNINIVATDNGEMPLNDKKDFSIIVLSTSGELVNKKMGNSSPVLVSIPEITARVGDVLEVPLIVSDPDGDNVSLVLGNLTPLFIQLIKDDDGYVLRLKPESKDVGRYHEVHIIAIDSANPPLVDIGMFDVVVQ